MYESILILHEILNSLIQVDTMNWNKFVIIKIYKPIIMKIDYKCEIVDPGNWYHRHSKSPLEHNYIISDDGLSAICYCGRVLRYTENFTAL